MRERDRRVEAEGILPRHHELGRHAPAGADAPPPPPLLLLPSAVERVSRTRRRSERLKGRASLQNKVP